jgi:hypothetical protein
VSGGTTGWDKMTTIRVLWNPRPPRANSLCDEDRQHRASVFPPSPVITHIAFDNRRVLSRLDTLPLAEGTVLAPLVGRTVLRCKVPGKLGGGSKGVVYRAQDLTFDRQERSGDLPPDLTSDLEAKRGFVHEVQAPSAAEHQNICSFPDVLNRSLKRHNRSQT